MPTSTATPEVVAELLAEIVRLQLDLDTATHTANHDALTQLPNRNMLNAADQLVQAGIKQDHAVVVAALDLVRFKDINDRHGHPAGDDVLVEYGRRLTAIATDGGGMALRLGGDEFALVLTVTGDLILHLQMLHGRLAQPMTVNGQRLAVEPRIGATLANDAPIRLLLGEADSALYRARRTGKVFAVYTPGTDTPPYNPAVHTPRPASRLRDIRNLTHEYLGSAA